ncbi:hypothetical protein Cus16_1920 [Curtobacterium sp. ER1/6]|nr:hypothetical protein Cus16_1920 [Curtobacterium sp. ER1/6]
MQPLGQRARVRSVPRGLGSVVHPDDGDGRRHLHRSRVAERSIPDRGERRTARVEERAPNSCHRRFRDRHRTIVDPARCALQGAQTSAPPSNLPRIRGRDREHALCCPTTA